MRVTGHNGLSSTKAFSLSIEQPWLTLHRITSQVIVAPNSAEIDARLDVTTAPTLLKVQPLLGEGIVAEGVTPLLIRIHANPATSTSYQIEIKPRSGTLNLSGKLRVLANGSFALGTDLLVSSSDQDSFALLDGIDRGCMKFNPGSTEMVVDVTLRSKGLNVAATSFKLRRPPVVLVHGIGSTAAWEFSYPFLDERYKETPVDFVIRVGLASFS
jgi:hypothetical protein